MGGVEEIALSMEGNGGNPLPILARICCDLGDFSTLLGDSVLGVSEDESNGSAMVTSRSAFILFGDRFRLLDLALLFLFFFKGELDKNIEFPLFGLLSSFSDFPFSAAGIGISVSLSDCDEDSSSSSSLSRVVKALR